MYMLKTRTDSRSTEKDTQMSEVMVDFLVSYAKTGVPKMLNVNWPTVSRDGSLPLRYISIKSPTEVEETINEDFGNAKFWFKQPFRENRKLFEGREETVVRNSDDELNKVVDLDFK